MRLALSFLLSLFVLLFGLLMQLAELLWQVGDFDPLPGALEVAAAVPFPMGTAVVAAPVEIVVGVIYYFVET